MKKQLMFKCILPSKTRIITAENRTEAIERLKVVTAIPSWYIEKHLKIVNMWRAPINAIHEEE